MNHLLEYLPQFLPWLDWIFHAYSAELALVLTFVTVFYGLDSMDWKFREIRALWLVAFVLWLVWCMVETEFGVG